METRNYIQAYHLYALLRNSDIAISGSY